MESNATQESQDSNPVVAHNELAIVLVSSRFDPAHINPDFLRHNEIVDTTWRVNPPVVIETGFSLVEYDNGLALTATNDYLRVSQTAQRLENGDIVIPDVVSRYLTVAPWPVEYQHIHTDLIGGISVDGNGLETRFSPLHDLSQRVQFGEVSPIIHVRAAYRFPDKSITMYVSEVREENAITGLRFSAHIHRDIDSDVSAEERDEFINATLEKWHDDTRDFDKLARQFYFSYAQKED